MNRFVNAEEILRKQFKIWNKIKSLFKKEFNSEPVYNDKYIKTKIKIHNDIYMEYIHRVYRVYTYFQHNKIPKDN